MCPKINTNNENTSTDISNSEFSSKILKKNPNIELNINVLQRLLENSRKIRLKKGEVLFYRGDISDSIYVPVIGSVAVLNNTASSDAVATIGVGEFIGEMGCITGMPRTATIQANRDSLLLKIDWSGIHNTQDNNSDFVLELAKVGISRLVSQLEGNVKEFIPSVYFFYGRDARTIVEHLEEGMSKFGSVRVFSEEEVATIAEEDRYGLQKNYDFNIYYSNRIEPSLSQTASWMLENSDRTVAIFNISFHEEDDAIILKTLEAASTDYDAILHWPEGEIQKGYAGRILLQGNVRVHHHCSRGRDFERLSRMFTGNARALVLSGGGARGLAHIGVYKFLEENDLEPDVIVGTSIGALIGAGIALRWPYETMLDKIRIYAKQKMLFELRFPKVSFFSGNAMRGFFENWFDGINIEDTNICYRNVSVDLITSKESVNTSGNLATFVRASASLPGVFPPVNVNSQIHVDGGVLNNLPVDRVDGLGVSKIIAIDIGGDAPRAKDDKVRNKNHDNILSLITSVTCLGNGAASNHRRAIPNLVLMPEVGDVSLLDFKSYRHVISLGYEAALGNQQQIIEILG